MKNIKYIFFFMLLTSLSSCYEEESWLDDNVTSDGRHFPVIQVLSVNGGSNQNAGANATINLQYWSTDPVKEIRLYQTIAGNETLVSTTPYSNNWDPITEAEVVALNYTVPNEPVGTTISLKVIVENENGLTRQRTTSIKII